jgi:hypothetical protein
MSEAIAGNIAKAQTLADGGLRLYIDLPEVDPTMYPWLYQTGRSVALAALNDAVSQTPAVPHETTGSLANKLHRQGYFYNPRLWAAMEESEVCTQAQHKQWLESQPCLQRDGACEGDVTVHHVRTAANSGTGLKPPHWYGVPLCHFHHSQYHNKGTRQTRDTMMEAAVGFTARHMKAAMKFVLKRESLAGITDDELDHFERGIGFNSGTAWSDNRS